MMPLYGNQPNTVNRSHFVKGTYVPESRHVCQQSCEGQEGPGLHHALAEGHLAWPRGVPPSHPWQAS